MSRADIQAETSERPLSSDKSETPRAQEEALQLLGERHQSNASSDAAKLPDLVLFDSAKIPDSAQVKDANEGRYAAQLMDSQGPNASGASSVTQDARSYLNSNASAAERAQTRQAFNDQSQYYVAEEARGVNGPILSIRADNNNDGRAD